MAAAQVGARDAGGAGDRGIDAVAPRRKQCQHCPEQRGAEWRHSHQSREVNGVRCTLTLTDASRRERCYLLGAELQAGASSHDAHAGARTRARAVVSRSPPRGRNLETRPQASSCRAAGAPGARQCFSYASCVAALELFALRSGKDGGAALKLHVG